MAKIFFNPDWINHNKDQRQAAIREALRERYPDDPFIQELVRMLDPAGKSTFKLEVGQRKRGRMNQTNIKRLLAIRDILHETSDKTEAVKIAAERFDKETSQIYRDISAIEEGGR